MQGAQSRCHRGARSIREAEWKQIFHEAWRVNRDFFYDPNMHGADWPAMEKKYEQFLPHLTSGGDLYKVIRWMLSELAVGHSYTLPASGSTKRKRSRAGCSGPTTNRQRPLPLQEDLRRAQLDAAASQPADGPRR